MAPAAIVFALIAGAGTLWGIVLFVVAGIMLATSTTGYCPNYTWLGISTEHGSIGSTMASFTVMPTATRSSTSSAPER